MKPIHKRLWIRVEWCAIGRHQSLCYLWDGLSIPTNKRADLQFKPGFTYWNDLFYIIQFQLWH